MFLSIFRRINRTEFPEIARSQSGRLFKAAVKIIFIRIGQPLCDFLNRHTGIEQIALCRFDFLFSQILIRRDLIAVPELVDQMVSGIMQAFTQLL